MKKQKLFLCITFFYCFYCFSQNLNIATEFYRISFNTRHTLTLKKDSTYTEKSLSVSCTDTKTSSVTTTGTYMFNQDKLTLIPKELSMWNFEGEYKKYDQSDVKYITEYKIIHCQNLFLLLNIAPSDYEYKEFGKMVKRKDDIAIENVWKNSKELNKISKNNNTYECLLKSE